TVARALRRQAGTAPAEAAAATADAVAATGPPIELVFDLLLAARRDADASASVRTALARALTACTAAARRMADEGRLPPDADPEATGLTMLYLIVGTLATRLHPSEDVSADEGFPFPPSLDLTETGGP
ncbi:MAG TPA: hypothetical protein VHJ17_20070, partial [Thermomonospora sp.]|nr:hypothetical protein [Thermomonospora sp.]